MTQIQIFRGRWVILLLCILCIGLQFLQLSHADFFMEDDFNFMIHSYPLSWSKFLTSLRSTSNPGYILFFQLFRWIENPIAIRIFILSTIIVGAAAFVLACLALHINWIFALLSLNLALALAPNAAPVFFVSAYASAFSWAFASCSGALFICSRKVSSSGISVACFILSVLTYWVAVTVAAHTALLPLVGFLIVAALFFDSESASGAPFHARGKLISIGSLTSVLWANKALAAYMALTTGLFLIRKFFFGVNYHYYKLGWVDYGLDNILARASDFFGTIAASMSPWQILQPGLQKDAALSIAATALVYVCLFLVTHVSLHAPIAARRQGPVLFAFLALFGLSLAPVAIITFFKDRYCFSPSIFLVIFITGIGYLIFKVVFRRFPHASINRAYYLFLTLLILIATVTKYTHVRAEFLPRQATYQDFKTSFNAFLKQVHLPNHAQVVILDHPARSLTCGFNHWSTGLINLTSKRFDLSGNIGYSKDYSDLFSDRIWQRKNGTGFRKTLVGMKRERPLIILAYRNRTLVAKRFFVLKEPDRLTLYETSPVEPSKKVHSARDFRKLSVFMQENGIDREDTVFFRPYPPDFFDENGAEHGNL